MPMSPQYTRPPGPDERFPWFLFVLVLIVVLVAVSGCTRRITGPDVCVAATAHVHVVPLRPHYLVQVTDSVTYVDVPCEEG